MTHPAGPTDPADPTDPAAAFQPAAADPARTGRDEGLRRVARLTLGGGVAAAVAAGALAVGLARPLPAASNGVVGTPRTGQPSTPSYGGESDDGGGGLSSQLQPPAAPPSTTNLAPLARSGAS